MIETSEFRKGAKLELEQQPYSIIDFEHHKPGKGNAITRAKLRNLVTGQLLERTFKSGEKFASPDIEAKEMQYLYREGEILTFMDTENYEQISLNSSVLKDQLMFLKDGINTTVLFYNGKPITVELPIFVELPIEYCEPGFKGDTATGATKPATLLGGHKVTVPLHLKVGDILKIDTRDGAYMEKVNK
jgi:elongation factor P